MKAKSVVKADVDIEYSDSDSETQTWVIVITGWEEFFMMDDPYGDFPSTPSCNLLAQGCSSTYIGFVTLNHVNGLVKAP